ncbi:MAG: EamA family transporter [Acetobacteraceae bacterium]|nr:EamA family transporter [Acetobacteraceae bacterium]
MRTFAIDRAMPGVFVVLWASGFLVARAIATHAEPLTFLTVRLALTTLVFGLIAIMVRADWPRTLRGWGDAVVAGVLLQGVYLGGVFWAARHGLPAALIALVAGLQPLLTAALAPRLLGERVSPRPWLGIGLGCAGTVLVLLPRLGSGAGAPIAAILAAFAAMLGITAGTIWQKRRSTHADLRTNAAIQFFGAAVVTAVAAALTEHGQFDGSPPLWAALAWSVFGLSVGAISLLLVLIKRGAVARVASLFYLTPAVTALMAFVVVGERLSAIQVVGMGIGAVGVALAIRD